MCLYIDKLITPSACIFITSHFFLKSNLYDVIVWIIQRAYCFMKINMLHAYYYVLNCYIETNTFLR